LGVLWKVILTSWQTGKLGTAYRVTVTIVKCTPFIILALWLCYAVGMGLANDICDCVKDYDGWWR
jgi:hypothetical protein